MLPPHAPASQPRRTGNNTQVASAVATGSQSSQSHLSFAEITAGDPSRSRSPSIKRKDFEVSPNSEKNLHNRSKQARFDSPSSSLLKEAAENLSMLEQVSNELMDATSSDPVLVALSSRMCQGMITQNNILTAILKSRADANPDFNIQPSTQNVSTVAATVAKPPASAPASHNPYASAEAGRRPLKQAPIGNHSNSQWNQVTNRKNHGKKNATKDNDLPSVSISESGTTANNNGNVQKGDDFSTAIRNAEKSVVIYNLNLGQAPLLNPNTISAKVTTALIQAAAANITNNDTSAAGEMVNDLISQVKGMDLFGKGTKPCKDPKNSSINSSFYTIPVKLTFSNKQVSKHVNEILRQKYKVSTSIPYHRTLKKAMSLAHEKISKLNPGKQVLISLDAGKKCLKPFTRNPPTHGNRSEDSAWSSAGNPIQLPIDALNPKLKDISSEFSLPASPTFASCDPPAESQPPSGFSQSGTQTRRLKLSPQVAKELAEREKQTEKEKEGEDEDSVFDDAVDGSVMEIENVSEGKENGGSGLGPED
jgi:hypothetical protein